MERLRILAAAAALHEFTVGELSAFAGANADTIRSVLRRDAELFELAPTTADGGPGRPSNRWRVKELDRIRDEIRELEQALQPAGLHARSERDSTNEDRLIAVASAEDAVLDAWHAEEPQERAVLAQTALAALGAAQRMTPQEIVEPNDSLRRRADDVEVFAQLAHTEAQGKPIGTTDLHRAATALSDLAEVAPERTGQFLLGLSATAVRNGQLLPLALALSQHHSPRDAISTLDAQSWVETAPLEDTDYVIWAQRWAAPLVARRLFVGTIIEDSSGESLDAPLSRVSKWRGPTVVVSKRHSVDQVRRVSEAGAYFLPSSAGVPGIARTVINSFGRAGLGASIGAEYRSFDFGVFGRHG
jgi:hypothetical protein